MMLFFLALFCHAWAENIQNRRKFIGEGTVGFHGLRVWTVLAPGFWDLRLNHTGFRILRYVNGCEFSCFLCSGFGYCIQNSITVGFS